MTKRTDMQARIMAAYVALYSATGWRTAEPLQWLAARGVLKDADDALNEHVMGKGPRLDYAEAARLLARFERQHTLAKHSGYDAPADPPALQKLGHVYPDVRDAVGALAAHVNGWSGYLQYEIRVVHEGGERAFAGFTVGALDFDGFRAGYVGPSKQEEA